MTIQVPEIPEVETFTVPIQTDWRERMAALIRDPETSHWLRRALVGAAMSPAQQAVAECEALLKIMRKRAWREEVREAVRLDLAGDVLG